MRRRAVMAGDLAPGTVLTLRGVAVASGTSAMPVREAFLSLVNEGAVTVNTNRSFSIVKLVPEQFEEVRQLRLIIEGEAIERAAANIDGEDLEKVKFFQARLESFSNHQKSKQYNIYNNQFHFLIYAAAGMPFLTEIIETLWLKYAPNFYFHNNPGARSEGAQIHADIVKALEARDGAMAREALHRDINSAADAILPKLVEIFD